MLGLVIVGAMFSSVVGTIVLPRGVHPRIAYAVWRAIHQPFMAVAGRMRRYESKDRLPGLLGPVCRCLPCSAPGSCCSSSAMRNPSAGINRTSINRIRTRSRKRPLPGICQKLRYT